jgi:hypothetical protein
MKSQRVFAQERQAMLTRILLPVVAAMLLLPVTGSAHHSAIRFDLTVRDQTVTGVVKEFTVRNPHTKIVLEVTDERGTRDIEYEGHSRNNYYRSGWRPELVQIGDEITMTVAPTVDGSDGGYVLGVKAADGTEF